MQVYAWRVSRKRFTVHYLTIKLPSPLPSACLGINNDWCLMLPTMARVFNCGRCFSIRPEKNLGYFQIRDVY